MNFANIFHINRAKRTAACLLAGIMAVCSLSYLPSKAADYTSEINKSQSDLDDVNDKLSELEQELKNKQVQLESLSALIAETEAEKANAMDDAERTIAELEDLKNDIENYDAQIEEAQAEYDKQEKLFLERAKYMYQNSGVDYLTIFFESSNIFDFIGRVNLYEKMLEEDKQLMEDLRADKASLEAMKANSELISANKETLLAQLDSAIATLKNKESLQSGAYTELQDLMDSINSQEDELSAEKDELVDRLNQLQEAQKEAEEALRLAQEAAAKAAAEEKARLEAEAEAKRIAAEEAAKAAQEAIEEAEKNNAVSRSDYTTSANFIWPIETYYCISSQYGYRVHPINGTWSLHSGVDLAANKGTKIYAAQAGVVEISVKSSTGYGYYIKIKHAEGLETLYAHCSELYVSAGDYVTQGQVIAAVGMTGAATGPHLHFEVIINGSTVQPLNYITAP